MLATTPVGPAVRVLARTIISPCYLKEGVNLLANTKLALPPVLCSLIVLCPLTSVTAEVTSLSECLFIFPAHGT